MGQPQSGGGDGQAAPGKEPEILTVAFPKVNGSMGLSIVAAKVSIIILVLHATFYF